MTVGVGAADGERGPSGVTDETYPREHDPGAAPTPPFPLETGERRLLQFGAFASSQIGR
jgi:hypothetical protein